LRKH